MATKNVTNRQLLESLVHILPLPPEVTAALSEGGAQNTEFKNNLLRVVGPWLQAHPDVAQKYGIDTRPPSATGKGGVMAGDQALFDRLKTVARWTPDPNNSSINNMKSYLQATGISAGQVDKIYARAQELGKQPVFGGGTVRGPGQQGFNDTAYFQAASDVLGGDDPRVGHGAEAIGTTWRPPPPAPPPLTGAGPLSPGQAPGGVTQQGATTPTPGAPPPSTTAPPVKTPITTTDRKAPAADLTPTGVQKAGGGAGDKGLPANAGQAEVDQYIRKNYGADAWMLEVPDLAGIVRDVVKTPGGWTQSAMDSAVQATPWWQQNGQNVADFLDKAKRDPIGLKSLIAGKVAQVKSKAAASGLNLSDERINQIATDWQKWGWDDNQANGVMASEFHYQSGQQGTVLTDKLSAVAKSYLVPLDDATLNTWGQRIIANPNDQLTFNELMKNTAIATWPSFADRLKNNETMQQISAPYANTAATLLEMSPGDIDFSKPKWMSALDQVDDKGNHTHMSQPDWTRKLQNDSQYGYDYTNQAKQQATTFATDILQRFGHMA